GWADGLDVKRVDPQGLRQRTDHVVDAPVSGPRPTILPHEGGHEVQKPYPAVGFLHPAGGRDGNPVLDEPSDDLLPFGDLVSYQRALIHWITLCFLSVMA